MMQQAIEHGANRSAVAQQFFPVIDGSVNAESSFMLSPDSDPAMFNQVEALSLRITEVAFSMAIS